MNDSKKDVNVFKDGSSEAKIKDYKLSTTNTDKAKEEKTFYNPNKLISTKLEEKFKKYGFDKSDKEINKHKHNVSSVDDLPPDPLQKRTVLPKKRIRFAKNKNFM